MINANEINIGDFLTHNKVGRIEVAGVNEHCSSPESKSYAVTYKGGWVYLHNCINLEKTK